MPWTPSKAHSHTKRAQTPAAKRQWATVANRVLDESGDEGKAIRVANAAVNKRKKKGR